MITHVPSISVWMWIMPNSWRSLHWRRLFKTIKPGFLKRMKNPLPTRSKVNYGEYLAFQTTETVADENAYGKFGRIIVAQKKVDLDGPCPEELHCGNDLNTEFLVNSLLSSRRRACLVVKQLWEVQFHNKMFKYRRLDDFDHHFSIRNLWMEHC